MITYSKANFLGMRIAASERPAVGVAADGSYWAVAPEAFDSTYRNDAVPLVS